ncbi:MAG: LamG domain-containing protein [Aminipila sp.]
MAKIIQGVDNVNRELKQLFGGVEGVNREFKERWEGVGGVNRKVFSGADQNTLLLLHGETITDSSPYQRALTVSGYTPQIISGKFNNAMYVPYAISAVDATIPALGTTYTIDFWAKFYVYDNSKGPSFIEIYNTITNMWCLRLGTYQSNLSCQIYDGTNSYGGSVPFTLDVWNHYAVVADGLNLKFYVNGSLVFTKNLVTCAGTFFRLFSDKYANQTYFQGAIDELRISNIARWVSNFTPPAEPYR